MHSELVQLQKLYLNSKFSQSSHFSNSFADILFSQSWPFPEEYICKKRGFTKKNPPKIESVKQKILLWFKKLRADAKLSCLSLRNTTFIYRFISILKTYDSTQLYCLKDQRSIEDYFQSDRKAQQRDIMQQLLKYAKVAFLKQPILFFCGQGTDFISNKLIEWMELVSNGKLFQQSHKYKNNIEPLENLLWFNSNSMHPLQSILVNQFEKSIIRNYYNQQFREQKNLQALKQFWLSQKQKDKLASFQQCMNASLKEIFDINNEEISRRVSKSTKIQEKFDVQKQQIIYNKLVQQATKNDEMQKKKRKRNRKKKNDSSTSKTGSPNKQQTSQQSSKKQKIIYVTKKSEQKCEDQCFEDQISLISKFSQSQMHQTDVTIQKYFENQDCVTKADESTKKADDQILIVKNNQPINQQTDQNQQKDYPPQHIKSSQNSEYSKQYSQNFNELSFAQNHKQHNNKLHRKRRNKKERQFQSLKRELIKQNRMTAFTQFIDSISIESNNLYNYKLGAYQFIAFFVSSMFPSTDITLFGSNAVGLALANSDIDIMLGNSRWKSFQQIKQVLYHLGNEIAKMGWVIDYRLILQAKVPVLKLYIDPKIEYFDNSPLKYANSTSLTESIVIKADIIINLEGDQNIGCQSTLLMKEWLSQHPLLQRIVLFFKYVLWFYDYNENYKGGICSYCIFLVVVGFLLRQKGMSKDQNKNQIILDDQYEGAYILDILRYYAHQFNSQTDEIRLDEGSPDKKKVDSPTKSQSFSHRQRNLKIVDPINNQYIESSFSKFKEIQDLLGIIYLEISEKDQEMSKYIDANTQHTEQMWKFINMNATKNENQKQEKSKKLIKKILNKIKKNQQEIKYSIKDIVGIRMKKGMQKYSEVPIQRSW